jgi:hypothetical protein
MLVSIGFPFQGRRASACASLAELEAFYPPSAPAPAIPSKHAHRYAEEEIAQVRKLGCRPLNWEEPEYPRRLLEIYDPSPLLCVRRDAPRSTGIRYRWWGRAGQRPTACRWRNGWRMTRRTRTDHRQRHGARHRRPGASRRLPDLSRHASWSARHGSGRHLPEGKIKEYSRKVEKRGA